MSSLLRRLAVGFGDTPPLSQQPATAQQTGQTMPAAPRATSAMAPADHDIGRTNEVLRSQIDALSHNFAIVDDIRANLDQFRTALGQALDELEATKTTLRSVEVELRVERLSGIDLRKELSAAKIALQSMTSERDRQAAQLIEAARSISDLEALVVTLETDNDVKAQYGLILQSKLDNANAEAAEIARENQILTNRITEADQRVARVESELTRAQADKVQLDGDLRAAKTALDASLMRNQELSRALSSREHELSTQKNDTARLRSDILQAEADLRRAIAELGEVRQKAESDAIAASIKIDAVTARADLAQRLLEEARQNFRDRSQEMRDLERNLADVTQRALASEARANRAEDARQKLQEQLTLVESARATMYERAESAAKALKAKETAAHLAEEAATDTAIARQRDVEMYEREIGALKARVSEMMRELQREQGDRAIAEGALTAARRDRMQLQHEVLSLKRSRRAVDPDGLAPVNDVELSEEEALARRPFTGRSA
jgi:chemotaxis protein MotB